MIFAALATFWAVNWLRSAIREPRAVAAAPMTLASDEAKPAPAPPREDFAIGPLAWAPATRSLHDVDSIYDAVATRWRPLNGIEPLAAPSAGVKSPPRPTPASVATSAAAPVTPPAAAPTPARRMPTTAVPVRTEAVTTAAVATEAATLAEPSAADDHPVAEVATPAIAGSCPPAPPQTDTHGARAA